DDTIHIGGDPPPLIFDPPPFTYTPPAFTVQLPPQLVYDNFTWNLDGYTFDLQLNTWQTLLGLFDSNSIQQAAQRALDDKINGLFNYLAATVPNFQLVDFTHSDPVVTNKRDFRFLGLALVSTIEVRVDTLRINYRSGRLQAVSKKVQPDPVTVDPPPFAFKTATLFDLHHTPAPALTATPIH